MRGSLRHQQARLVADQHAAGLGIGHDRRHQRLAGLVVQRRRLALARDRDHGVGRAEIDADRQRPLAGMRQRRFARLVDLQQAHAFDRSRFMRRAARFLGELVEVAQAKERLSDGGLVVAQEQSAAARQRGFACRRAPCAASPSTASGVAASCSSSRASMASISSSGSSIVLPSPGSLDARSARPDRRRAPADPSACDRHRSAPPPRPTPAPAPRAAWRRSGRDATAAGARNRPGRASRGSRSSAAGSPSRAK